MTAVKPNVYDYDFILNDEGCIAGAIEMASTIICIL